MCRCYDAALNTEDAKLLLSYHSGRNPDIENPKWTGGFLGSLRPFRGSLTERNFHEVMACLRVLAVDLGDRETLDRDVVADLWAIVHLGRAWALAPGGMLRRNRLITEDDRERMEAWLDTVSYAVLTLLDGAGEEEAFGGYDHQQHVRED